MLILVSSCSNICNQKNKVIDNSSSSKIRITLFNHSLNKENISVRLIIDNKEFLNVDSVNYKNNYNYALTAGTHFIEVSKSDGTLKCYDTIEVKNGGGAIFYGSIIIISLL